MIRSMYFDKDNNLHQDIDPNEFSKALADKDGVMWFDFSGAEPKVSEEILLKTFGFHPLAVDDALRESHVPKLDDWENYLYIVMHDINFSRASGELETSEIDIFLGPNYLVTYHEESIRALERAWQSDLKDLRHYRLGADHLLYRLTDELISDFMNTVDEMDEEIEVTEDSVLRNPTTGVVEKIFTIKRATLHLRRSLSPLREVLNKLARDDFAVIDARDRIYFRDIYDHLVRLHDISEGLRDLSSGVLDTYLSVINNRMNEVMKTLTIITTIFMPISFLAGFFGMNFFVPEHPYPLSLWVTLPVYIPVLFIFVVTPILMFLWFRKRGWM